MFQAALHRQITEGVARSFAVLLAHIDRNSNLFLLSASPSTNNMNGILCYQSIIQPSSQYHTALFKVPYNPLQSTTQLSSKYHTTLFKVPYNPLQSTIQPSSKYHTALFKVPYSPLQSTTQPSSKYHTTLFKVPYNPLHTWLSNITTCLVIYFNLF